MSIDTNVYLSRWPFRRLRGDEPAELVNILRDRQVTSAWVGSFDGLLHKDVAAVNLRLIDDCSKHGDGMLVPFGTVNPNLPDWEEDLRRCHEDHKMPGIRLHPNYHRYTLDDPRFARLLAMANERKLIVQIALKMEDERTQHPLLQVPEVDTGPLADLVGRFPKLRLVILNGMRTLRVAGLDKLLAAGEIFFEISMLEGVGGVSRLISQVGVERILFGSYFPFFIFESAQLKLRESELTDAQTEAIVQANARRILAASS